VVAIGGASGTLSEIAYAWMYDKPIVALTGGGGWTDRLGGAPLDDRRTDRIQTASSVLELEQLVGRLLEPADDRS